MMTELYKGIISLKFKINNYYNSIEFSSFHKLLMLVLL